MSVENSTSVSNLVIADDDFISKSEYYLNACKKIEEFVKSYTDLLSSLKNDNAIEGDTAETIASFADLVASKLDGNLTYIGTNHERQMNQYIEAVDYADGDIYKFED